MNKQRGYTIIELIIGFFYLVVLPAAVFGWGWNIYKIVNDDWHNIGLMVVRIAGIFFPPLGAVIGYF